jgi:peptidoglycan glycosyltransferase
VARVPSLKSLRWLVPSRAVVAVLLVGALALGFFALRTRRQLDEARRLLHEGRSAEALELYRGHGGTPFVVGEVRAGMGLGRLLEGDAEALLPGVVHDARQRFDLVRLADHALRRGHWPAVLSIVEAAGGTDARGQVLAAAAALELGRDDVSRAHLDRAASGELASGIRQALDARAAGARTFLRDRNGVLLGWLDVDGRLMGPDPLLAGLLPMAAVGRVVAGAPSVRLTVDLELSRLAQAALGAKRGSIVLVDPGTGAILAAVTDARTLAAEGGVPAFEQRREPASIQKLLTSTATLRAGVDPDAEVSRMTCNGHQRYGTRELWCSFPAGPLRGLAHALAVSCNVAFANLGQRIGLGAVLAELRRFGFDRPDGLVRWGRVVQPTSEMLPDLSIGLEATDITPAHAALLGAVFADGRLAEPSLVAADDSLLGLGPRPRPVPEPARVFDERHLPVLWRAMEAVTAAGGTAEGTDDTFPVAMKTGTAATPGLGYHVNYVGAGPLPRPKVAFCIRVTNEGSSRTVNEAAREVTRALFEGLGRRYPVEAP